MIDKIDEELLERVEDASIASGGLIGSTSLALGMLSALKAGDRLPGGLVCVSLSDLKNLSTNPDYGDMKIGIELMIEAIKGD